MKRFIIRAGLLIALFVSFAATAQTSSAAPIIGQSGCEQANVSVTIRGGKVESKASTQNCNVTVEVFTEARANGSTTTQGFTGSGNQSASSTEQGTTGCYGKAFVKINGITFQSELNSPTCADGDGPVTIKIPGFPF